MKYYKPIEIARTLHISTSALRHYEKWGIVPEPDRNANGYRMYTEVHFAYFRCVRAMFAGFGVPVTSKVLKHIQKGEADTAFWLINKEQAALFEEKTISDETLKILENPSLANINGKKIKKQMAIGEAAKLTGVPESAIRHWEKEDLIQPERDPDNGYRIFTPMHIRQILLIRTLRRTVYFLENMKEIVAAVENQSIEKAKKVAEDARSNIHYRNRQQLYGIHQLMILCTELGLISDEPYNCWQ